MISPLYRLQQEFERQGLKLSRQTMSNWLLSASDTWLKLVYDELHRKLCQAAGAVYSTLSETVWHTCFPQCEFFGYD